MNDGERMIMVKKSAAVLVENSTFKRRRSTNNVLMKQLPQMVNEGQDFSN
jgi:hypothetical protein